MSDKTARRDRPGSSGPPLVANLRRLREAAGLTQDQLARTAGVMPRTVQRLEAGHNSPKVATLRRLALALGVSPEQLQGAPGSPLPAEHQGAASGLAPAGPMMKLPVKGSVAAGWPDKTERVTTRRHAAFWRCPRCGNAYNLDVPECPNDGSRPTD